MTKMNPEERQMLAEEYFRKGYNCSQAVALAFRDVIGLDEKTVAGLASGFGGGMGRLREVCGAFSGCVLMAGVIRPADNPEDRDARTANYALVQKFAARFREENGGSIVCRELLGLGVPGSGQPGSGQPGSGVPGREPGSEPGSGVPDSPAPSERTAEYYRKRPCVRIVGAAARIIAEELEGQ